MDEEVMEEEVLEAEEESSDIVVEGYTGERVTNPIKAIRKKCLDCCCGQRIEVELCPSNDCYLWPFRRGKNPYRRKRELSEEQKEVMRERMSKFRSKENEVQEETCDN